MKRIGLVVKSISAVVVYGVLSATWAQQYTPPKIRTVQNLNRDWKFIKQDVAVATATGTAEPGNWGSINLPHSFDIPYWMTETKPVAPYIGWYRTTYTVPQKAIDAKKRFTLEFEGAFLVSTVYVNGDQVGQHKGGYTPFSYDITGKLKTGANIIAVKVDGTWNAQIAPRGGDHIFIGGIYRNVSMIITDPLHVDWYGTFITTPSTSTVKVKTDVVNANAAEKNCKVKTIVVDESGSIAASMEATKSIAAGSTDLLVATGTVTSPKLWSPETPNLYKAYSEVYDGTQLVDVYETSFGIRTLEWSATQGFSLNGKRYWLHGANAHQDHAGWGDAITDAGNVRDVKLLKDCGMNFIRGSHYPHAPAFADACDKLGMCFWSEAPFWCSTTGGDATDWRMDGYPNNANDQNAFDENMLVQLSEMLKCYRNHPSIIVWSMTNEPFFAGSESKNKALLKKMVDRTHAEDSTRLAAIGGCQRDGGSSPHYDDIGDIAGYNGDGATIYMNPTKPSVVTEYGSCNGDRPGTLDACWGSVQTSGGKPTEYAWRAGIALWCAFHYGTWSAYGNTGMIDHARIPLRRWYYYRNANLGTPNPTWPVAGTAEKLAITTDAETITDDGKSDAHIIVQIQDASGKWLSNTANVTLTTTNGLFPSQGPAGGNSITFTAGAAQKGVREGLCAIEFRSYSAGTATITATSGSLTATKTITVQHVENPEIIYGIVGTLQNPAIISLQPISRHVKFVGSRFVIPPELRNRNCVVEIFTIEGKRLVAIQTRSGDRIISLKNTAKSTLFARLTTLQ
jgi:hypothetical protein